MNRVISAAGYAEFCYPPYMRARGHGFGVGSIALLRLSRLFFDGWTDRYRYHYYLALVGIVFLGFVSEGLQFFHPHRDADPWDLLRDGLGGVVFLSVSATLDPRLRGDLAWFSLRRWLIRGSAALLLAANFVSIPFDCPNRFACQHQTERHDFVHCLLPSAKRGRLSLKRFPRYLLVGIESLQNWR